MGTRFAYFLPLILAFAACSTSTPSVADASVSYKSKPDYGTRLQAAGIDLRRLSVW
jgi:hypothetical protein